MDELKVEDRAPRIAVLQGLLEVYTLEQLQQFMCKSKLAKAASKQSDTKDANRGRAMPDILVRFSNGHPRWIGIMDWEEMDKP